MRRKQLKSRKKMHKYKKLITGVQHLRKKESILEEYVSEDSDFEFMINAWEENKKSRNRKIKYENIR